MRNIFNILTIAFFSIALVSCDAEKRDQDVSGLGSTEGKTTASVSADISSGEIAEGATITYTISLDKPVIDPIGFSATLSNDSEADANDIILGDATIQPYFTEATITIEIVDDMWPELSESAEITIEPNLAADSAPLLNSEFSQTYSYTITNVNSDEALTVGLTWNEEQAVDLDVVLFDANGAELAYQATGDVPEINPFIPTIAPDGTYFIGIDPYEIITPQFEYTFAFSEPNGEITTFSGVFDTENLDAYTVDISPSLGGASIYRLVKVVKTGANFEITQLP